MVTVRFNDADLQDATFDNVAEIHQPENSLVKDAIKAGEAFIFDNELMAEVNLAGEPLDASQAPAPSEQIYEGANEPELPFPAGDFGDDLDPEGEPAEQL
jgi:hypothetical protein